MTGVPATFVLLCVLYTTVYGFYETTDVVSLKKSIDIKQITESPYLVILEVYRESCGFCKILTPEYEKVATYLRKMVVVAAVDVEKDRNVANQVIKKYGINVNGVPTLVLLKPKADGSKELIVYNGERNYKAIVDFAVTHMPSSVESLTTPALYDKFVQSTTSVVVLLSNKKTAGMIIKALSTKYKHCKFGLVHDSQKVLVQQFQPIDFPSIFVLPSGSNPKNIGQWMKFDGKMSFLKLDLFLMDYCKSLTNKKEL